MADRFRWRVCFERQPRDVRQRLRLLRSVLAAIRCPVEPGRPDRRAKGQLLLPAKRLVDCPGIGYGIQFRGVALYRTDSIPEPELRAAARADGVVEKRGHAKGSETGRGNTQSSPVLLRLRRYVSKTRTATRRADRPARSLVLGSRTPAGALRKVEPKGRHRGLRAMRRPRRHASDHKEEGQEDRVSSGALRQPHL